MITINTASPALLALAKRASNPTGGLMVAGRAIVNLLKKHYRGKKQSEPNKLGGKRTNYWRGVADSVNKPKPTAPDTVSVSISHPTINQKIFGGTITAKRSKYLTIPIHADAHGRTAGTLERNLAVKLFVLVSNGKAMLAGTNKDGKTIAYYLLKKSVKQRPDPTALPPREEMERVAVKHFGNWLLRQQKA